MRRLISVGLVVALLLAAGAAAMGVLGGFSRSPGEAASSTLTCTVKSSCAGPGEVAVFRMSGLTNAHAETAAGTTYGNIVCCSGVTGLSTSCTGYFDTAVTLSATDNAHAASDASYGTQACLSAPYTVMDCQYGSSCGADYACLATISGTTNAHVADCDGTNDYGTKVCCAALPDYDGDGIPDAVDPDADNDGCTNIEEQAGAPAPKPGATGAFNPLAWYDFYDVPVGALKIDPSGVRDHAVTMSDVLAVLAYVGDTPAKPAYNTDINGNTVKDGLEYDRSPSADPNPPWDAGPPDSAITMGDVLAVLAQVGLRCVGPP